MKKYTLLLFLVINFVFSDYANIHDNSLLFCIDKNEPTINFNQSDNLSRSENHQILNNFFHSTSNNYTIKPWLNSATEDDHSGDIYLNRI